MEHDINQVLELVSEMESFSPAEDELSALVSRLDSGELSEDDLSMVSAAYAPRPYSEFLKKLKKP